MKNSETVYVLADRNKLVDDGQYMHAILYMKCTMRALLIGCNKCQDALALCTHAYIKQKHIDSQQVDALISPVLCLSQGHQSHRPRKV